MRRRLVLVSAAVTTMVVIAFVIPLAQMVRVLASDRVLVAAERDAQAYAQALGVLLPEVGVKGISTLIGDGALPGGARMSVAVDGQVVSGPDFLFDDAYSRAVAGEAFREHVDDGETIWVPVLLERSDPAVIRVFVPEDLLRKNVGAAWGVLAALGVALILLSALVADRLGRTIVQPVRELSSAAHTVVGGDLSVRVNPAGPAEVAEVGKAFNRLVGRIGELLAEEREAAADLSHRLRTPLTALRLDIEALGEGDPAVRLSEDLDALERTVDDIITRARRPIREGVGVTADLGEVVGARADFWGALADEQNRPWVLDVEESAHLVSLPPEDVVAVVDALIGNVFAHTPEGAGFRIAVRGWADGGSILEVQDDGPGFAQQDPTRRGHSGAGSTGLGLDIVRRTAESTGGSVQIVSRPAGGGTILVCFGAGGG